MNIWFQIALGLCPAVIFFLCPIIYGLIKKTKLKLFNVIAISVFTVASVSMCIVGLSSSGKDGSSTKQVSASLELAYAIADAGDFEQATEIVDSLRAENPESTLLTECDALLYAAKGDARAAKALLVKANMQKSVDDYDELISLCNDTIAENSISLGQETDGKLGELKELALKKIEGKVKNSKTKEVAAAMAEAEKLYNELLTQNNLNSEKAEELADTIESCCERSDVLSNIKEVRLCRQKLLILAEKYDTVADELEGTVSFDELAIVAEMYINDLVDDNDFSPKYGTSYMSVSKKVSAQLKKIKKNVLEERPDQKAAFNSLLEGLEVDSKNPAISRLKSELHAHAQDTASADRPKAYMQLARIEYAEGNDEAAAKHISSALNTVGVSDDDSFSEPMINMVDSITDKDNVDKVKDIAKYATDITKNSSDFVVVKAIEESLSSQPVTDYGDEENAEQEEDNRNPFEIFFADKASQKRNAFSITSVDATKFDKVQLVVNVDPSISITAEELKELINLKDCNVNIEDFTVEKVTYSGANILLCCDASGSMSGKPIADLREAVKTFVESSTDIESIALVPFDDSVLDYYHFGTDKDTLISAADRLYAGGGTNMYGAIIDSIPRFDIKADTLNFILLMSDGEDNTHHSYEEIAENIGEACKDRGIVLFSLGLGGNVNADYMNDLATSTGGYFVYVSDSTTLNNFYDQLRSQILNRYIVTYQAKDTLRTSREVTISLKDSINDNIVFDTKQYTMYGTDVSNPEQDLDKSLVEFEGFSISGLEINRIFGSKQASTVNLIGTKLTEDMVFDIKLDGKLNYEDIAWEYVDSSTITLTLPGGMACGTYDLIIEVDGKLGIFEDELHISAAGSLRTTTFGNYVFTSESRAENEDGLTLSGFVTMNGWLTFKGDVLIKGDLEGYSINVTDNSGFYIQYFKDSATGLAKILADKNIKVHFSALGSFDIYNDTYSEGDSPEHRVDTVPLNMLYLTVASLNAPGIEVYPDKILVKTDGFTTKFPLQDTLLSAANIESFFTFDARAELMLTNKAIDFVLEVNNKPMDDDMGGFNNRVPANFGMMPLFTNNTEFEIKINTNTNEYLVDFAVEVPFIKGDGIGLKLEWGERDDDTGAQALVPKTVMLKADFNINTTLGVVPVTYRDFKLGLTDIDPNKSILYWKLVGSFDLESTKLSSYIPALAEYIDDPAILKLDDVTTSLSLGQAYIGIEAEAKLLEEISLAKLSIEAGKIPYKCELLGIYTEQTSYGMKAALETGITWETDNVHIQLTGEGLVNLHTKFFGVEVIGTCDLGVEWWIFEKEFYAEGRALIGFMQKNDNYCFVIKGRSTTGKGSKEAYVYIDSSGLDCGVKKL